VLHKCANPVCLSPFRKLSQGKLFLVEAEARERSGLRRARRAGQPSHRIEYYWLCDQCAFVLTLSYEEGQGVIAVPRPEFARKMPRGTAPARENPSHEASLREQSA
jgi:hypothetical protein